MAIQDDRQEFEASKVSNSLALGRDDELMSQSIQLALNLEKYNYPYLWSWMGVPIIQLPADVMATQEVIWATQPDVIIETGVARGGSLIFMASILASIGNETSKVIGVDIDIRAHNRESIEAHPLARKIELIQGPSTDQDVLDKIRASIPAGSRVMVVLDSDHSYSHVLRECIAYGELVTPGCYLVVADTLVGMLPDDSSINRSRKWTKGDDPLSALRTYMEQNDLFERDDVLNGKLIMSSSPGGYLRRKQA